MDEELLDKLSSILSEKNININDILENFQNTSSKVIGVKRLKRLVESDNNQTKGLTIFPSPMIIGTERMAKASFRLRAIRLG